MIFSEKTTQLKKSASSKKPATRHWTRRRGHYQDPTRKRLQTLHCEMWPGRTSHQSSAWGIALLTGNIFLLTADFFIGQAPTFGPRGPMIRYSSLNSMRGSPVRAQGPIFRRSYLI